MDKLTDHILIVQRNRLSQMVIIVICCMIIGLLYPVINKEFDNPLAFLNGFLIGLLGGLSIAFHEDSRWQETPKREHFMLRLTKRVLTYTLYFAVLVAAVIALTYGISSGQGVINYVQSPEYQHFLTYGDYPIIVIYALFFCGVISFTLIMSRKVESRIMFNMISGRYRKPVVEDRIFLSMDLDNSTKIAEELGEDSYFDFLNSFYRDLTPAVLSTNGQIYRYIGDQVLISWEKGSQVLNGTCLRTYFITINQLNKRKEYYLSRWNMVPSIKAVFHAGKVVAGEIGDLKSQFVFHGKVLHQLSTLEKQCKSLKVPILLSGSYLAVSDIPSIYHIKDCSVLDLPQEKPLSLFTLDEGVPQSQIRLNTASKLRTRC